MKFGKVDDPSMVNFQLPADHPATKGILQSKVEGKAFEGHIGCAKWNRTDLKNFYPRGTKDELAYYSTQFNAIELNATFYRIFPREQFEKWRDKTPDDFKFFPKIYQGISHHKRLKDAQRLVDEYEYAVTGLGPKLGMCFLQMPGNFAPKDFERVKDFLKDWPKHLPLAFELRHTDWYNDNVIADELYELFEQHGITNNITDTAGRRDLMHMRLTTSKAFVRYTGANRRSDYSRLDDWVERIAQWKKQGLQALYFFVHQNLELESPLLSAYFIKKLNAKLNLKLTIPRTLNDRK